MRVTYLLATTLLFTSTILQAGTEGMPGMPLIQPKKMHTVQSAEQGDELLEQRGFGDKESEVRMMNLMMVEGSGYEGMDMESMTLADGNAASSAPAGHSMNHGNHVATNNVSEEKPKVDADTLEIHLSQAPDTPKVGSNVYEFTVKDLKTGKAAVGLKLSAQVYMTNMDMGIETPKVKDLKSGKYQVKAIFSMKGPWAIKLSSGSTEKVFDILVAK